MSLREQQVREYLEEAELTLYSARVILEHAKQENKALWAHAVKSAFDAMEQAISAALAFRQIPIPKEHPQKISIFINEYQIPDPKIEILFYWLRRRSKAQYVDIVGDRISIPHELFDDGDAELAIANAEEIIELVKNLIK